MRSTSSSAWRALWDAYHHQGFPFDARTASRFLAITYFATYALLILVGATRGAINDATRALPSLIRPPPLVPIDVAFGLPQSVAMGLVSLTTAVTAVLFLATHDLVRRSNVHVPDDDHARPLGRRRESLSVLSTPGTLKVDRFPRLPTVEHPFDEAAERDEPSLEEVFHHGGPGARLRSDWGSDKSGVRTPRIRVDGVQVPARGPNDTVQVEEEEEEEELASDDEEWPGEWHSA